MKLEQRLQQKREKHVAKVQAIPVVAVEGCRISDDGATALLRLASEQGPFTLGVPADKIRDMLQLLSTAGAESARIRRQKPNIKYVASVERWEIGAMEDRIIFAFKLPGGSEQAYQVGIDQAGAIANAIASVSKTGKSKK